MKKTYICFILVFISLFFALNINCRTFKLNINGKILYLRLPAGWKQIPASFPDKFTAMRGNDVIGFQIERLTENYEDYVQRKLLSFKGRAWDVEKNVLYIEGIAFVEFLIKRELTAPNGQTVQHFYRYLLTHNKSKAMGELLTFYYSSRQHDNFLRTLNEIDIIVSGFLRDHFPD